jgi:hypothetical protein
MCPQDIYQQVSIKSSKKPFWMNPLQRMIKFRHIILKNSFHLRWFPYDDDANTQAF